MRQDAVPHTSTFPQQADRATTNREQVLEQLTTVIQHGLVRETRAAGLPSPNVAPLPDLLRRRFRVESDQDASLRREKVPHSRARLPRDAPGQTGTAYQEALALLDPLASRRGQVFTPWPLAQHLAALLEPEASQRWLDPAAGAGIFLQAAISMGVLPTDCQALEPDPVATSLGRALAPGSTWRDGDALAPWDRLPEDWPGGFDRVILNPPFRNGVERRDEPWVAYRETLRGRFSTARGSFDLYVPFIERALDFLAPEGRLGLLVPNTWLASRYGAPLRNLLAARAVLLRLQHAPGCRLFPRADFELLLLILRHRSVGEMGGALGPELVVERLDRQLAVRETHGVPQTEVRELAGVGWGPLLCPPGRRRHRTATGTLGGDHAVMASMSAAEFYGLEVEERDRPGEGELMLLSSGAIEPFHHTWHSLPVRFRGSRLRRPVILLDSLSPARQAQVISPRVLIANLSRRIEALAVAPGTALGVVNVIQVLCGNLGQACALAAWLNSGPLQDWVRTWHDPLRMSGQLSLNRDLVRGLPGPPCTKRPGQEEDARHLEELGGMLAELATANLLTAPEAGGLMARVDALADRWLPKSLLQTTGPGPCANVT